MASRTCTLLVFFGLGVYPMLAARYNLPAPGWLMAKQLKLGLDLKGGVHLVLRVHTDDALRITTTTTSEQLREALKNASVSVGSLKSPLPGIILDITCNVGDTVKKGQKLLILEAMKMENNIIADRDGTIQDIKVRKGHSVLEGTELLSIG